MKIKKLRIWLLWVWAVLLITAWLLNGCTSSTGLLPEPAGGKEEGMKFPVSFSMLYVYEGEITRSAEVLASGQLRLVVYKAGDAPTATPVENRVYNVTDGLLSPAEGEEELKLEAGNYLFYACMPEDRFTLVNGVASGFAHGDDPQASLTKALVEEGSLVMLEPLTHKASRVGFTIVKAEDATYTSLLQPSCLTLYSQPSSPVTFTLGEGGGRLDVSAGLDTLCFKEFTVAGIGIYEQDRVVLPRPAATFNLALETQIDLGDGSGPKDCTVRGQVENRMFEPGRFYHFTIRVKDLREGGDIMLMVTDWNSFGWEDNIGGNGMGIVAGHWNSVIWNDDMGS